MRRCEKEHPGGLIHVDVTRWVAWMLDQMRKEHPGKLIHVNWTDYRVPVTGILHMHPMNQIPREPDTAPRILPKLGHMIGGDEEGFVGTGR